MAGEWRTLRLGQAVILNPSVDLKRGAEYPFVDMQAIIPGSRCVTSDVQRVFNGGGSRFATGDTLMARISPCLENGKIARFCAPENTVAHGSTEFIVMRGREGVTLSDFVYYLALWGEFREYAISQMTGTSGRQRVPTAALDHLLVPIPPLDEQRAIAHILGTLDDKIELNRRMSETLEAMARALFKSWFVDFDPIRAKATRRQPVGMNAELAAQFPDRFEATDLGNVPAEWKRASFGTIAENWRHAIDPQDLAPDTPYIGLEHMRTKSLSLDIWGTAGSVTSGKTRFQRGDVLFGRLRPYFHKVGIAFTDGVCSTDILVIRAKRPEWYGIAVLVASSDEMVRFADSRSTGTRMPRVSWKDLAQFPVVLPPDRVARAFDALVSPLLEKLRANALQSRTLAALRDALLPKLVSGEIRVSAAAPLVESVL